MRLELGLLGLVVGVLSCQPALDIEIKPTERAAVRRRRSWRHVPRRGDHLLDARRWFDPDGVIAPFRWQLVAEPQAGAPVVMDATSAIATVTVDVVGSYVFEVAVTDDGGATSTSRVAFAVAGAHIDVSAGADVSAAWRDVVQLAGSAQVQPGFILTSDWTLISRPNGSSAVLEGADTMTPSFRADAEGVYVHASRHARRTTASPTMSGSSQAHRAMSSATRWWTPSTRSRSTGSRS